MDNIWHNFRTCSVREKLLLLVSLKASIYTLLFGFYFLSTDLVLAGSSAFVVASIYMTQFCLTLKGRAWEGVLLGFYAATLVIPFYMLMSGGIYSPVGIYCFQIATMAPIAFNRNRLFHCILTSIILGTVLLVGIIIDYPFQHMLQSELAFNLVFFTGIFSNFAFVLAALFVFVSRNEQMVSELKNLNGKLNTRDQEKDQLLQLVSHEIRAPLMHFSHAIDKLRGHHPGDKTFRSAELHSSRILRITNQLLDLEASKHTKPSGEYIEVLSFFHRLEAYFEGLTPNKTVRFERVKPMPAQIYSEISIDNLEKICINYLSNALKYTPKNGEVTVEIRVNQENLLVKVKDQGPGIERKNQQQLFKMFSRLDHQNTGSGIGLALVLDIVTKHQGRVGVDSELGKGSTFWFMLPTTTSIPQGARLAQPENKPSATIKGAASAVPSSAGNVASSTDLWVVDDDPFVHDIWLDKYEDKPTKIRCFYNPEEMKDFVQNNPESTRNLSYIITDFHFGDQTVMEYDWRGTLDTAPFEGKVILSSHMDSKKDFKDHFDAVMDKTPLCLNQLGEIAS